MPYHYVLLDACVAVAHFAPKTTNSSNLRSRATSLITGTSTEREVRFLIPNFCIAEVFAVLEKYRWGKTWNSHVKSSLTPTEFASARSSFGAAIHNGSKILQVELNRYHILCVDLISPVNNAYQITRKSKKNKSKRNASPAGTYDMLFIAMGIWLKKHYGDDSLTIITGDARLTGVLERAKSAKLGQPIRQHLTQVATNLGLTYSPDLYPTVINITKSKKSELDARLPGWSLPW